MDTNIQTDEQVIITGLDTGQQDYDYSMTELAELAQANHMTVVQRVDQVIDRPNPQPTLVRERSKKLLRWPRLITPPLLLPTMS